MVLQKIKPSERREAASVLAGYWKGRGMPEYGRGWALSYLREGHRKEVANDEFFAFHKGGNLIGVVSLVTDVSGVAEIRDMVLKKEFRGEGYGKIMVEELMDIAKKRKIRKLFVLALKSSEGVFLSAGFEKEGMLKSHFKKGENLQILSKFLK
jgi:N-acetylglutamate synthase-like GNAT family acetyltransferase